MKLFRSRNRSNDLTSEPTLQDAFMASSHTVGFFMERISELLPAAASCSEGQNVIIDNFLAKTISFATEDAVKDLKTTAKFVNDVKELYVKIEYTSPAMAAIHQEIVAKIESDLSKTNEILDRLKASVIK